MSDSFLKEGFHKGWPVDGECAWITALPRSGFLEQPVAADGASRRR